MYLVGMCPVYFSWEIPGKVGEFFDEDWRVATRCLPNRLIPFHQGLGLGSGLGVRVRVRVRVRVSVRVRVRNWD